MEPGFREHEEEMKCVFCRNGETQPGEITVTLQRGNTTVILRQAPADVCDYRGEACLSSEVTGEVQAKAEAAVKSGAEVAILRFAAYRRLWRGACRLGLRCRLS